MDLKRLQHILRETIVDVPRTAKEVGVGYAEEGIKKGRRIVKVYFRSSVVGVDKAKAEKYKSELIAILKDWPPEEWRGEVPPLQNGPSWTQVGGVLGHQAKAFQLFALGKALGLWEIKIPQDEGITGPEADLMMAQGGIWIVGFQAPD